MNYPLFVSKKPSAIQNAVILPVTDGKDVIARAQSTPEPASPPQKYKLDAL